MLHTVRISSFLEHGAYINFKNAQRGKMALHLVTAENKTDVVNLLLDHIDDVSIKDQYGWIVLKDCLRGSKVWF